MFSGKSSDLIRQIHRYQISKRKCLLLKYAKDTRYSTVRPGRVRSVSIFSIAVHRGRPLRL